MVQVITGTREYSTKASDKGYNKQYCVICEKTHKKGDILFSFNYNKSTVLLLKQTKQDSNFINIHLSFHLSYSTHTHVQLNLTNLRIKKKLIYDSTQFLLFFTSYLIILLLYAMACGPYF